MRVWIYTELMFYVQQVLLMSDNFLWRRFCDLWYTADELNFTLDVSRIGFTDEYLDQMSSVVELAITSMHLLEAGTIANRDENRMVGHYWLRDPDRAPTDEIRSNISETLSRLKVFAEAIHHGTIQGAGGPFKQMIHVGIGGSALGPQFICQALVGTEDRSKVYFLDNADPDGIDYLLTKLADRLCRTLISVVSKSGWTPTPWHVMLELEAAYRRAGLDFARHAVATTMADTQLDERARTQGWLARFPLWDWIGGRTSVTSVVGLLPAAIQGIPVETLLDGAATMDRLTRSPNLRQNPAALLALAWYWQCNGCGDRDMVILPYRDRLSLLPRYIQQLVMESLGKKLDRDGNIVHQGLTVYGYKGSTDQHAYMQQLRDGPANFFMTFIRIHQGRTEARFQIEPGVTLGDYLFGYLEGTRNALYERGRGSITIGLPRLDATSLGALIALYERAVGIYAEFINVNAYHQPGVDKDAGTATVALQKLVIHSLSQATAPQTAEEIANEIGQPEQVETVYKILD